MLKKKSHRHKVGNSYSIVFVAFLLVLLMSMSLFAKEPVVAQDDYLPKVLIIGDSISIGYQKPLSKMLSGKAAVYHPGNAQDTGKSLKVLEYWIVKQKWDIIHFNWGLWDLCYHTNLGNNDKISGSLTTTLELYENNLRKLVARLKTTGAILIWANTTPVPEGEPGRIQSDELKYNQVAEKVMRENKIKIDDLHSHVLPRLKEFQLPNGNVHFRPEGYEFLASKVTSCILEELQKNRRTE